MASELIRYLDWCHANPLVDGADLAVLRRLRWKSWTEKCVARNLDCLHFWDQEWNETYTLEVPHVFTSPDDYFMFWLKSWRWVRRQRHHTANRATMFDAYWRDGEE